MANTWGAKGMFAWDSPHHLGTCGLQADDFALLGFGDVDLLVATGLDPDEAPEARWALAPHVVVAPEHLGSVGWRPAPRSPAHPTGSTRSSPRSSNDFALVAGTPLPRPGRRRPARRAPWGGVIAADPGLAGLWIARTFPTTDARRSAFPPPSRPAMRPRPRRGAFDGRPAIAVTTAPVDSTTARVLELAAVMGVGFPLELWADEGRLASADDHCVDVRTHSTR